MIVPAIALALLLVIGLMIMIFAGRPKIIPPLKSIMPNSLQPPEAQPYYAQTFKTSGGLDFSKRRKARVLEANQGKKLSLRERTANYVSAGIKGTEKTKDLAIVGRTVQEHANQKLNAAIGTAVFLVLIYVIVGFGGITPFQPGIVIFLIIVGILLGFFLPETILKSNAKRLRFEFDVALYSWLDIVSQYLTTGEEAGSAMIKAASLSKVWPFQLLYSSLSLAQLRTTPVYFGLDSLAKERGLENLNSLRDNLKLSTDHGVELRDSLRTYIQAYRTQSILDAETKVKSFAEQAALPLGMVVIAFVVLLAYPGIQGLLGGSGLGGLSPIV